ncbi:DODA-type extradiol aromatic ring-opening family dioxygenase [Bacillus pseudomycoides]|uniref:DODA-type extradiol aromatic ring-opening family dioxygenase n=1 Tax=Bacillus pseudomycoides TaxID=64104 RepID=UPI000BF42603|nr:class III extradiol ring-cleavage dioxygenase [Bacillus pseudomycoides]PGC48306.1 dioxygenase [Bacillus pseudomycoides]PGD31211.1 dioxygenase [Bacillus pseudomycoides]
MIPSLFLAHGSPMLAIQDTDYTRFLKTLGETYKPKAIVIFTAHWETEVLTISSSDNEYETIYDFGGFPPELYEIKYKAKGSSAIATMLETKFKNNGIPVHKDTTRGLDHGSWTLLHRMYPKADIPVVQISVNPFFPAKEQYEIGQAIQGLGQKDILVIASGVTVHNLRVLKWDQTTPERWAVEFDDWIINHMQNTDKNSLFNWETAAPHARLAVPRAEHFVPLLIAMGSGNAEGKVIHRSYELGTLSYLCFQF